ncbi:MAG: glutamyl-tRNA reductase [Ferruginibacter sp.]|nr:glutamyl-tRNA reductase [Ferruginibacter sp.]
MISDHFKNISSFFIAGINYKKSDASVRGRFSINSEQYSRIISRAAEYRVTEFFVLSTCNRTEIYGFAESAEDLAALLCTETDGSQACFQQMSYSKQGEAAMLHLFEVAAGLDSQILGDYEIVGQIKMAAKFAKEHGFVGAYLERLVNEVLQTTKKIRTNTAMSGGTVSVSFAAVQYIRQAFPDYRSKTILLIGTGKIGTNTCKNIGDYLPGMKVMLMNRSPEKARALSHQYHFDLFGMDDMSHCLQQADIVVVATGANEPVLSASDFSGLENKLVIDLSIPYNVALDVKALPGITLINVDELSKIKDETLHKRAAEIPAVKKIISFHLAAFMEWHGMRRHVPILKAVKVHLRKMQVTDASGVCPFLQFRANNEAVAEEKIQKVINTMAVKLRTHQQHGCQYIEAMNHFIADSSN